MSDRLVKPKTRAGKRAVEARAPRMVEVLKKALLLFGGKTSQVVKDLITDIGVLRKGESVKLSRKNDNVHPFETGGEVSLEFLARKADCGVFAVGSHSKKRPNNIVFGRMFDFHVLDLLEVENYRGIREFGGVGSTSQLGGKPLMVFTGELFETDDVYKLARNILLDFFRGRVVPNINLKGLDRVLIFTAVQGKILLRQCSVKYKKSGTDLPKLELVEMGPSCDLVVRRHREAPPDVKREAYTQQKAPKKKKNIRDDEIEGKVGRIYIPSQDVDNVALFKPKGVKRQRREAAAAAKEAMQDAPEGAGSKKRRRAVEAEDA